MATSSSRVTKRKSADEKNQPSPSNNLSRKQKKINKLAEKQQEQNKIRNQIIAVAVIYVLIGVAVLYFYGMPTYNTIPPEVEEKIIEAGPQDAKKVQRPKNVEKSEDEVAKSEENPKSTGGGGLGVEAVQAFPDFKVHIQKTIEVRKTYDNKKWKKIKISKNNATTAVRIYVMDDFLSPAECDGLMRAHERHIREYSQEDPLICFSDIYSLKKHLIEAKFAKLANELTEEDFTPGTSCLNATLSSTIKKRMKWSQSTSFYPGESKFSKTYEKKVQDATGLDTRNGGKFQVTSYLNGVGYKGHTDCVVGNLDGRDRYGTILVYLKDVEEGGHTVFPELGVKIKPRRGRALLWNNMDEKGVCDPLSYHKAAQVTKGSKVILQRWYYYQNFPMLGKRYAQPPLPPRGEKIARVSCDEYEFGSCRWYDEWTYDHLKSYNSVKHKLS